MGIIHGSGENVNGESGARHVSVTGHRDTHTHNFDKEETELAIMCKLKGVQVYHVQTLGTGVVCR